MIIAALPETEALRLVDLESYDILDTIAEDDFDELVELAGQICNCPISFISLMDKERQWFKSIIGIAETETTRDIAFCSHAILQDDVMVVEDTANDIRFHDNPFVTGDANIRFYAGAPIVSPSGNKLGTICILDNQPRKLLKTEERALTILSNQVTRLLELRKKNLLIRERAEEVINLKSRAISSVIKTQEEEKRTIASNMHEDLAQGIASSIFYLQTAETDRAQSPALIKTAKHQLQDILVNMQDLSYSITPHIIDLLPATELVHEYVEKITPTFPFSIQMKTTGRQNTGTADNALNSIRIIEQWLKLLADKKEVTSVNVTIHTTEHFELLIEDNGPSISYKELETAVFDSLVYERACSQGGTVELSDSVSGKNQLKVRLPIVSAN